MNDLIPIPVSDVHTILDALGKLIERQEDEIHDFQRVIKDNRGTEDMFDMIGNSGSGSRKCLIL